MEGKKVLTDPTGLITEWCDNLRRRYRLEFDSKEIRHELCKAPVNRSGLKLPKGHGAVYVFSLRETSNAPAGANRVLKVGKVGPNSLRRFSYQHYKAGSANSTLAGSLKYSGILWDYIGIGNDADEQTDFGVWLIENTDRDHFFMTHQVAESPSAPISLQDSFEIFLRGILGPVFEG